mmetsp:Transcript_23390/g.73361  ORF Transcript_23390/g.73361 Transcript_23390/m.73361 type:complete len:332 (-) Transcript_23390:704-1699(-)
MTGIQLETNTQDAPRGPSFPLARKGAHQRAQRCQHGSSLPREDAACAGLRDRAALPELPHLRHRFGRHLAHLLASRRGRTAERLDVPELQEIPQDVSQEHARLVLLEAPPPEHSDPLLELHVELSRVRARQLRGDRREGRQPGGRGRGDGSHLLAEGGEIGERLLDENDLVLPPQPQGLICARVGTLRRWHLHAQAVDALAGVHQSSLARGRRERPRGHEGHARPAQVHIVGAIHAPALRDLQEGRVLEGSCLGHRHRRRSRRRRRRLLPLVERGGGARGRLGAGLLNLPGLRLHGLLGRSRRELNDLGLGILLRVLRGELRVNEPQRELP